MGEHGKKPRHLKLDLWDDGFGILKPVAQQAEKGKEKEPWQKTLTLIIRKSQHCKAKTGEGRGLRTLGTMGCLLVLMHLPITTNGQVQQPACQAQGSRGLRPLSLRARQKARPRGRSGEAITSDDSSGQAAAVGTPDLSRPFLADADLESQWQRGP